MEARLVAAEDGDSQVAAPSTALQCTGSEQSLANIPSESSRLLIIITPTRGPALLARRACATAPLPTPADRVPFSS